MAGCSAGYSRNTVQLNLFEMVTSWWIVSPLTTSHRLLIYFIMAVAMSSTVSACCRWFSSRMCGNTSLIAPLVQFSSLSCAGRTLPTIARLPIRCPRAFYYVKPKEKKGPSLKSWMLFGAGCAGIVTGAVVYVGKRLCNRLLLYYYII